MDALPFQGTDVDFMVLRLSGPLQQIGFIIDDEIRQVLFPDEIQDFVIGRRPPFGSVDDDDGYIRLVEDLFCPPHPFFTQGADVVETRRIDDDDWP